MNKHDPETRLTRQQLAKALTEEGYPTSVSALDTKASRGGGPPYEKYAKYALYAWGPALAWARNRTAAATASEHRATKLNATCSRQSQRG